MRRISQAVAPLAAGLLLSAVLTAGVAPPARRLVPPPATAAASFQFSRLDHAYGLPVTAAPIREGELTVRLSSPQNKIVLRSHRLRLAPTYADGSYAAELTVELFGKGSLVADVDLAGHGHRFTEPLLVPPQTRVLSGRVRVSRSGDGYLITPMSLPATIAVQIRSGLGDDVVGLCERLAAIPFSTLECDGLDRALSTATVPLPGAGESFWLGPADVTAAERRQVESYLAATAEARARARQARR